MKSSISKRISCRKKSWKLKLSGFVHNRTNCARMCSRVKCITLQNIRFLGNRKYFDNAKR